MTHAEVNTPKVSTRLRNLTGQYPCRVTAGKRTPAADPRWATETHLGLVRRARRMNRALAQAFPHVYCELDFTNPLELTVATILSAQSTDKGVNLTTPALFARYRTARDYAGADRTELEELIRPTGFYRNKASALIKLGQALEERFDGEVPATMAELVTLPGVGRKTANVILGNAFGVPGITVDTHFGRLVRRWGWTAETIPSRSRRSCRRADRAKRMDAAQSPRDLPRPAGVPRAHAGVRSVRAGQGLPVVRSGTHRTRSRRRAGEGTGDRTPAGTGRDVKPRLR